jgi:TPR repeat protein
MPLVSEKQSRRAEGMLSKLTPLVAWFRDVDTEGGGASGLNNLAHAYEKGLVLETNLEKVRTLYGQAAALVRKLYKKAT